MENDYFFVSERLGFRNWRDADIPLLAALNADPKVMKFFPGLKSYVETEEFIRRMQMQMTANGFCYYAVDKLAGSQFIGFIGMSQQLFESPFTPCIDIGWRLSENQWGNGFATEGARRCLDHAFSTLGIANIRSFAPIINVRSEQVMKNIGMTKMAEFVHPLLINDERLRKCLVYEAQNNLPAT